MANMYFESRGPFFGQKGIYFLLGAVVIGGIKGRLKKIGLYSRAYLPVARAWQRLFIFLDATWSAWFYGCAIDDYFRYYFFLLNHTGRRRFIVWRQRRRIILTCNDKAQRILFDNKCSFNETFAGFIGRQWLDTTRCSYEEFLSFAYRYTSFFVKPIVGSFGQGARVQAVADERDLPELFCNLQRERVIVEELIQQLPEMAEFNPTSVNTLRLVTLLGANGAVKVMTASLRLGVGGKCADNFHQQGVAAAIDLNTGLVVTTGVDMESRRYPTHPVTGKAIVGFMIPFWDKVLETVVAAAKVVPGVRYVGWDVALGADGQVFIIEGNYAADPDVNQMPDQQGKWPLYEEEIKRIANLPKKKIGGETVDKGQPALF